MSTSTLFAPSTKPIPVAPGLPLIGNLLAFSRDPLGFFKQSVQTYEEIVKIKVLGQTYYDITHPALVEQVLVTHNDKFIKDKQLKVGLKPVFGNGLVANDGDFWLRQRRMAQPAFHRQRINGYAQIISEYGDQLLEKYQEGEVRDIHEDMMSLTLDVVAKALFNLDPSAEVHQIGHALDAIMARFNNNSLIGQLEQSFNMELPRPTNWRYREGLRQLDAVTTRIVEARRQQLTANVEGDEQETGNDLLAMLMEARDEHGQGMSDPQLRDECRTMFIAGHETTALALSWTWWLLDQHPDVKHKLHSELVTVLAGRIPTLADLPNLRYTQNVITESMRLQPPAWIVAREAIEDVEIGGYLIPKGAQVGICTYAIQRDPRWFANAERFDPDRWEGDLAKRIPRFAYFPFGGGQRFCIGQQFALMEAQLVLAAMAQRFDLHLVPGHPVVPQPSVTMRPKFGLKMKVVRR